MLLRGLLLPSIALSAPLATLYPRQTSPSNVSFTITNFKAFMADPEIEGVKSNLSFHVVDSQLGNHKEVDCVIPPTYFWLYAITALYEYCPSQSPERPLGFSFTFEDGVVGVRRGWVGVDNRTYTASGTINPYWTEGANKTTVTNGTWVTQPGPWVIKATRLQIS